MNFTIEDEVRKTLDSILSDFEFNEVIDIKKGIRKSLKDDFRALNNTPVSLVSDTIKEFLIRYSFAINFCGDALINSKGIALKNAGSLHAFQRTLLKPHDFIVIDDDKFNNIICDSVIRNVHKDAKVESFTDPNIGLRHINTTYRAETINDVILLLDINMPTLLGWEVLDEFKDFPDIIKNRFKIFMLTSSLNPADKERACGNPLLWGYIEKPLTEEQIKSLLFQEDSFNKHT